MSRLCSDPEIRKQLLILLICLLVASMILYFDSGVRGCISPTLLCDYYNVSGGRLVFHRGCVKVCNMSDVSVKGYLSGLNTSTRI